MVTTPTFWSGIVTFSNDIFAFNPKVTALDDDSFAIVWGNGTDLFGRHLDHFGGFTGGNFLSEVSAATSLPLHDAQIFQQSNGALVVNFSRGASGANNDIFWHQANRTTPSSTQHGLVTTTNFELLEDSGAFGSGSAFSYFFESGGVQSLLLRYVNSAGAVTTGALTVGTAGGDLEDRSALVGSDLGNLVVVAYRSFHLDATGSSSEVRFRAFNAAGTDVTGEVTVNNPGASFPDFPDVTLLGNGGLFTQTVVTWQQGDGIAYRHFLGGVPATGVQVIPDTAGAFTPEIVTLDDLGYIIAWTQAFGTEPGGSPDLDIVLQRFDIDGDPVGSKVFIDLPGDQALFDKSLTTLSDGRVVLAFQNETGAGTNLNRLDYVILDPRENTISGDNTANTIVGRLEASTINGIGGADKLFGMNANDTLNGGAANDLLFGGAGRDTLNGDVGSDKLTGGLGKDTMTGGTNLDVFDFNAINESPNGTTRDVINAFQHGVDDIDLRTIDAKTGVAGNNAFKFIGTDSFNDVKGELRINDLGAQVIVQGDVNGNGVADFEILVKAGTLTKSDFLL